MHVKHSNTVGNSYCQDTFLSPMWLCNPLFLFLVTHHLFSVIITFSYDMKETLDIYSVSLMVDRSSITTLVILLHIHINQIILEYKLIEIANHEWIIITIISAHWSHLSEDRFIKSWYWMISFTLFITWNEFPWFDLYSDSRNGYLITHNRYNDILWELKENPSI